MPESVTGETEARMALLELKEQLSVERPQSVPKKTLVTKETNEARRAIQKAV